MGIGGISPWQLLIILIIVLLIFGTKKLRGIGTDLGGAIKGFKKSMAEEDEKAETQEASSDDTAALNENAAASEDAATEKEKEPNA